MKSGVIESDRIKIEARQSIHRRRMSKNAPIVNGAEDNANYAIEEESMVRQVNLAAAFHDHISCTKSAELGKIPETKEGRVNLPCETDHIYANCSEKSKGHTMVASVPSSLKDNSDEVRRLQFIILCQLDLIKQQQAEISRNAEKLKYLKENHEKELTTPNSKKVEKHQLKTRLEQTERKRDLLKKRDAKSDDESTDNLSDAGSGISESLHDTTVVESSTGKLFAQPGKNLAIQQPVNRYLGRRSRTIPSRTLKRRYSGPSRQTVSKRLCVASSPSTASLSSASASETQEEEKIIDNKTVNMINMPPVPSEPCVMNLRKNHKKRGRKPFLPPRKDDFLQTDKPYYLSDSYVISSSLLDAEKIIDVPSWRYRPVSSFYKMENAEDINDSVFSQRHLKFEKAEKQRKRWDMQRFKEQAKNKKLKLKKNRGMAKDSRGKLCRKINTFYPDPANIEYIEVYDSLPVLAFGHLIPLFQPCEFSLPWFVPDNRDDISLAKARKHRSSSSVHKVT